MNKKSVLVPEGTFRSKLTGIASALFAAAALTGIISILSVFAPDGLLHFRETAAPEGIKTALVVLHGLLTEAPVDEQVTLTFAILLGISILLGTLFSAALAVGIFQMQRGKAANGAQLIALGAKILFYATTAVGIGAAAVFAIRLVTYVMMYLSAGFLDERGAAAAHNPKVQFNEDVCPIGASCYAHCATEWLKNHR